MRSVNICNSQFALYVNRSHLSTKFVNFCNNCQRAQLLEVLPVNFYNNFIMLCHSIGKKPSVVAEEAGLSKSLVSRWKQGKGFTDASAAKIAEYFGISIEDLTVEKPDSGNSEKVTDADLKFALFGGDGEITDAMFEEVKRFAAFVKQREQEKEAKKD